MDQVTDDFVADWTLTTSHYSSFKKSAKAYDKYFIRNECIGCKKSFFFKKKRNIFLLKISL